MREINKKDLDQKRIIIISFILFFFAVLLYGFISLQLGKSDFYAKKSIDNSVRKITTLPVRGLIKDSKDNVLVDNNAA